MCEFAFMINNNTHNEQMIINALQQMLVFDVAVPGPFGLCPACLVKPPQSWRPKVNLFQWHRSAVDFRSGFLPTSMCKCHAFGLLDFTSGV